MRVAIALARDGKVYPGPFGHAPFYAVYEVEAGACRELERVENPYAREEGGNKPEKLKVLLSGTTLWVGRRFGHDRSHPAPPVPHRKTDAQTLKEALRELGCASTT